MPAKAVRPFVTGNKSDAHDARAIWTAVQQPGVKTVAIKTEEQQAILALHRMRQQLAYHLADRGIRPLDPGGVGRRGPGLLRWLARPAPYCAAIFCGWGMPSMGQPVTPIESRVMDSTICCARRGSSTQVR